MKKNVKKIIIIAIIAIVLIICGVLMYFKLIKPHNEAVAKYNKAAQIIKEKNNELDDKVKKVQDLIDSNEKVIDDILLNKEQSEK